jgi:hypothetical protein
MALAQRGAAFGSSVASDLPLPLGRGGGKSLCEPLWVRRGRADGLLSGDRRLRRLGGPSGVVGMVSPRRRTVWIERAGPHPGAMWGAVMGISLPHLLSAAGSMVLRASCAAKDDRAVAFLGPRRAGKSSITAALLTEGWRVMADDALLVRASGGSVHAQPSFPAMRLWAPLAVSMASTLGLERAPIHPAADKEWVFLNEQQWSDRAEVQLACLCVLDDGRLAQLRGTDPMRAILAATYDPEPRSPERRRRWFRSASQLASSLPVLRMSVPADYRPDFRFGGGITRQLQAAKVL